MFDSVLLHYLTIYAPLGYLLIFVGLLFEGEFILFTAAFLTHRGVFDFGDMFLVVISSVLIGDMGWYFLGRKYLNGSFSFLNRWVEKFVKPFDDHLVSRPLRTILIVKFTYGFYRATLLRCGSLKISLKEFFKADLVASIFWIAIVGGLGYGTSSLFLFLRHYLKFAEVALFFGLILFFALSSFISRRSKRIL